MNASLLAFLFLFTIALRCEGRSRNRLPASASRALSAPSSVILYSLEPEEEARWLAGMPKSLHRFWTDEMRQGFPPADLKPLRAPLMREFPDATRRILALFNWYGSSAGPWSGFPSYEGIPEQLLLDFPTAESIAAIEGAKLTDFELKGASRYFAASDFSRMPR